MMYCNQKFKNLDRKNKINFYKLKKCRVPESTHNLWRSLKRVKIEVGFHISFYTVWTILNKLWTMLDILWSALRYL